MQRTPDPRLPLLSNANDLSIQVTPAEEVKVPAPRTRSNRILQVLRNKQAALKRNLEFLEYSLKRNNHKVRACENASKSSR